MAKRPTIALTLIAKDEEKNLPVLLDSVAGCFDEIHLTDSGSIDNTITLFNSIGEKHLEKYGTKFVVHVFPWIKDFSAARNHALPEINTDYWMWLDLDDSLCDADSFIKWRDNAMRFCNYFVAPYHYAIDKDMNPIITFARERVFKNKMGYAFNYFVHEGVKPVPATQGGQIITWSVKHRRSIEDLTKDKGRNLAILELNKDKLDTRMIFYYGKELFENSRTEDAARILFDVCKKPELELHDRIMAYQYFCYAAIAEVNKLRPEHQKEKLNIIIQMAMQGGSLDPERAEFWSIIGDCFIMSGQLSCAIPYYAAAKSLFHKSKEKVFAKAIHITSVAYEDYPRYQTAKIYFNLGNTEAAEREIDECMALFPNSEAGKAIHDEIKRIKPLVSMNAAKQCDDIVITAPPGPGAYLWDSKVYKERSMGGSETAAIEMSQWLKKLTGRPVKIFNHRESNYTDELGVEYLSQNGINEYFRSNSPKAHIAWRHNVKLTNAMTYLWCHDLVAPGIEHQQNFDFLLALSPFHSRYIQAQQGLNENKIILTRNGIKPERFLGQKVEKNPNQIIFPSSPDRGLIEAIHIVEKARKTMPDLELHGFYGLENLYKYGLGGMADAIKALMKDRPWVKYHGGVTQEVLIHEMKRSSVWLYPASFIESFCITALESVCSGTWPLCRDLGALPDTLRPFTSQNMATILDHGVETDLEQDLWAGNLIEIIGSKKWEKIAVDPGLYSWEAVARQWIEFMNL